MNRSLIAFAIAGMTMAQMSSCVSEGNDPGIEYAPNMYVSEAYEAYTQTEDMKYNPNGMTMREPVEGTIARGQLDYAAYTEGYEASASWTNPYPATEVSLADAEVLYLRYCSPCHGKAGKNDGNVVKNSEYPPPPWPNYQDKYIQELPMGKIFHTITFGKGLMGSHASVLTPKQRWQVANYVKYLSNPELVNIIQESEVEEADVMELMAAETTDSTATGDEGSEMETEDHTEETNH